MSMSMHVQYLIASNSTAVDLLGQQEIWLSITVLKKTLFDVFTRITQINLYHISPFLKNYQSS